VRSVARLELVKGVLYEEGRTVSQWYSSRRMASLYERFRETVLLSLCFTVYISLVESVAFRYRELLEVYGDAYCTVFRYLR
jgi:hypothetical protein